MIIFPSYTGVIARSSSLQSDTVTFSSNVSAASGSISNSVLTNSIDPLVTSLASFKSNIVACYPIVGNDFNAGKVRLYGSGNLTTANLVSSNYAQSTGITQTASGWILTPIQLSDISPGNFTIMVYVQSINYSGRALWGWYDLTGNDWILGGAANSSEGLLTRSGTPTWVTANNGSTSITGGLITAASSSNSDLRLYSNSSLIGSNSTTRNITARSLGTMPFLGLRYFGGVSEIYEQMSGAQLRFAIVFNRGLTATEIGNVYTAIQTFQTSLSRNV